MTIGVRLDRLTFSGGDVVDVPADGVLLLVGPNNVGKSVALNDIRDLFTRSRHSRRVETRVVADIDFVEPGDRNALERWLDGHAQPRPLDGAWEEKTYLLPSEDRVQATDIEAQWRDVPPFGNLAAMFLEFMDPTRRLAPRDGSKLWDRFREGPSDPLQVMFDRLDLEEELRRASVEAFGEPVFVNRYGGSTIKLQLGWPPEPTASPPTPQLVERLRDLPTVGTQGDGFKVYLNILETLIARPRPLVLIDEPELFLHPPQSKLMGRKLAEMTPSGTQIVAATHSSDLLVGALEAQPSKVTVVRMTRQNGLNHVAVLPAARLQELWADPVLRHSKLLDGLFYQGVVLCEADGDCMFFAAALDHFVSSNQLPAPDLLFVHSAGKERLHTFVKALRAVNVPVRVIADIDILRNDTALQRVVEALGGDYSEIQDDRRRLANAQQGKARRPTKGYVEEKITEELANCEPGGPVPDEVVNTIKKLLGKVGGWDELKRGGTKMLSGDDRARCDRIISRCNEWGLLILNTGELESFNNSYSQHGPAWVTWALDNDVHTSQEPQGVVEDLLQSLGLPNHDGMMG